MLWKDSLWKKGDEFSSSFCCFLFNVFSVKRARSLFMYYAFRIFMAGRPLNLTPGSYLAAEHEFPWEEKNG